MDDDSDDADIFNRAQKAEAKKKPVGGVALFGGADLFGRQGNTATPESQRRKLPESATTKTGDASAVKAVSHAGPTTAASPKTKPKASRAPAKAVSLFDAGSDDDDDDDEDIFAVKSLSSKPKPSVLKPVQSKAKTLFDDDHETNDLFSIPSRDSTTTGSSNKANVVADDDAVMSSATDGHLPIDGVTTTASTTDKQDLFNQPEVSLMRLYRHFLQVQRLFKLMRQTKQNKYK